MYALKPRDPPVSLRTVRNAATGLGDFGAFWAFWGKNSAKPVPPLECRILKNTHRYELRGHLEAVFWTVFAPLGGFGALFLLGPFWAFGLGGKLPLVAAPGVRSDLVLF